MRNKLVVKKDDYERYKIPISFFNIFPKKKSNFLWEELEKRHPCFSDEFCYSSKNCISRKGLFSDVVVMEKAKFAEYKNKCSFAGTLSLEDSKRKIVLKNKKNNFLIAIAGGVFFILFFIISKIFITPNNSNTNISKNIETNDVMEESVQNMKDYNSFDKNILSILFDVIRKNNGKISSLNWNINCTGENISTSLDSIYPEQLETVFPEVKIPVVKYQDKSPYFDFNFTNNFLLTDSNNDSQNISIEAKKVIRTFLKNNGIELVEESIFPYGIEFNGKINRKSDINFISKLGNLLNSIDINVISVVITPMECNSIDQSFHFYLKFSNQEVYKNNILNIIGKNIDLLFKHSVPKLIPAEENRNYVIQNNNAKILPEMFLTDEKKIGEIKHTSGPKVVFYKNNEGKMLKKEVCNEK